MSSWYDLQMTGFNAFIWLTYLFYFSAVIGVAFINPKWFSTLDQIVKLYIGLFLVFRFNYFRGNVKFTNLDRKISFHAGVFILSMLAVNSIFTNYIPSVPFG